MAVGAFVMAVALADAPSVVDHPLLHLGPTGRHAGSPVAVAGVRCFQQIPRTYGETTSRVEWFYCAIDASWNVGELQTLPAERTQVRVGPATVTVHPAVAERHPSDSGPQVWTLRRVDVAGAAVKILGTEFRLPRGGQHIGYVESEDGRGAMYGRTVFELSDAAKKEFVGGLAVMARR